MFCTNLTLRQEKFGETEYQVLRCRCWTCDYCAKMRKKMLINECLAGTPNTFITLSVNPHWFDTPEKRAVKLAHAWRKIRRKACTHYGYKSIPFMAVFERTKAGEPHLHILARVKWIDQAWLSAQMDAEIGAPIVDIRRIRDQSKIAFYVAKYVGKDPVQFRGCKRYWRSLDFLPKPEADQDGTERQVGLWTIEERTLDQVQQHALERGFHVIRSGDTLRIMHPPHAPPTGYSWQADALMEGQLWSF